jgi:hypothetical protein
MLSFQRWLRQKNPKRMLSRSVATAPKATGLRMARCTATFGTCRETLI